MAGGGAPGGWRRGDRRCCVLAGDRALIVVVWLIRRRWLRSASRRAPRSRLRRMCRLRLMLRRGQGCEVPSPRSPSSSPVSPQGRRDLTAPHTPLCQPPEHPHPHPLEHPHPHPLEHPYPHPLEHPYPNLLPSREKDLKAPHPPSASPRSPSSFPSPLKGEGIWGSVASGPVDLVEEGFAREEAGYVGLPAGRCRTTIGSPRGLSCAGSSGRWGGP